MSDQIIIDLGTKAVVRLQSADGLIEHKLFSAYSTWPYDAIEKSFRENIERLEMKEKKQFHLYLNADTYSKKETVDVHTLSIGLFNALQKESNSVTTPKLTVIFSAEESLEFQSSSPRHGCNGSTDEPGAIPNRVPDSPEVADFKEWIKVIVNKYWPRIHRDQEEDGETYGSFALQKSRKGSMTKYFWNPGRVRALEEIKREGKKRNLTDYTKFFKFVTNYTNNTTSNLRKGKLRYEARSALEGTADVYWDSFGRYIRDDNGEPLHLVPPGDDWTDVRNVTKSTSAHAASVSCGLTTNIIQSSAVVRENTPHENESMQALESSDDEDLREQACANNFEDVCDAILDSQLHTDTSAFDITEQSRLLRRIAELEKDIKTLKAVAATDANRNDCRLKDMIKQKDQELRDLTAENTKLQQARNRKRKKGTCSNVESWLDGGRRYISSASDRAERSRRKRNENTPGNTDMEQV